MSIGKIAQKSAFRAHGTISVLRAFGCLNAQRVIVVGTSAKLYFAQIKSGSQDTSTASQGPLQANVEKAFSLIGITKILAELMSELPSPQN